MPTVIGHGMLVAETCGSSGGANKLQFVRLHTQLQ